MVAGVAAALVQDRVFWLAIQRNPTIIVQILRTIAMVCISHSRSGWNNSVFC